MGHQNFFEYQPTKDLNRLLREYGQTCLNSMVPSAPAGNTNITWQTDSIGNISAYTPSAVPLNPRGIWSSGTTYNINDLVTFSGSSYVSAVNGNIGNQPDTSPADWQLIAQGGGGSNPGTATKVAFYQTTGSTVSPTNITSNGSNLNVPGSISSTQLSSGTTQVGRNNPLGLGSLEGFDLINNVYGPGWSLGNQGSWSVFKNMNATAIISQRGIGQNFGAAVNKRAVGDTAGIYSYVFADGGLTASSDEGVTAATFQSLENAGFFHGTVTSSSQVGGTPTLAFSSGNNWTTDGAFLLNITKSQLNGNMNGDSSNLLLDFGLGSVSTFLNSLPITTVTVTASAWVSGTVYTIGQLATSGGANYVSITNGNVGNTPASSPSNWTLVPTGQLPISTAIGISISVNGGSADIPVQSVNAANPQPISIVVNLARIGGVFKPFVSGGVVTISGQNYPEQSVLTGVTTPTPVGSNMQQTLSLSVRNPNVQPIIFQGGVQGTYISFDANLAISGMPSSYLALGSLNGTQLIYALQIAGGVANNFLPQTGSEAAQSTGSRSGFHLYPGAEVVANNDIGFLCTLEQNGVHWGNGDSIQNPHYPAYGGSALLVIRRQITPSNTSFGSALILAAMEGPGTGGGNTSALRLINSYGTSLDGNLGNYSGSGGPLVAPGGIQMQGQFNTLLSFDSAPNIGPVLHIGNNPTGRDLLHVFDINYASGGNMFFTASTSRWQIDGSFDAQNGFFSNHVAGTSGSFTSQDGKTVTVSGGIIIGIV